MVSLPLQGMREAYGEFPSEGGNWEAQRCAQEV